MPCTDCSSLFLAAGLGCMITLTVIGNALVCISVFVVRRLRHPSNHLLVSLAVSDLCVALLVMPLALHFEVAGRWDLGPTVCDMWVSFDVTSCTASILNLCMISVDRYLAITRPLTYGVRRTARRIWSCIGAVWLLSCLISVPPLLVLGNEHGTAHAPTCLVCQSVGYQLYATLGAFYIPLIVMIALYYKIYVAAKRVVDAERQAQVAHRVFTENEGSSFFAANKDGGKSAKRQLIRKSSVLRERKASITLGIIMTAFTACWLPFFVVAVLRPLAGTNVPPAVHSFTLWLGYANSMLNPVIYVTFHHDFRRAFRELLCFRCSSINSRMRSDSFSMKGGPPIRLSDTSIALTNHHGWDGSCKDCFVGRIRTTKNANRSELFV
ncbi:5-hydroxytryptamine receptor 1-like [Ornithodoros turicata]|uniref:5-hydroxytryptamine receptor 1-like n=1 Tax=Ornithodoros turicata TaxID=34597 RepID=UPI00313A4CD4